jgi:short-subunit dehydrogenase
MRNAMELAHDTRVLVTGASRGIGRAVASAFAERGCVLGLVARSSEALEELAASLPGTGHRALAGDVAEPASIARAVEEFGDVDVLVANAGIAHYLPFAEMPIDQVEQLTRVNWLGTTYTVKAVLPRMLARGRGQIAIVSSGAGIRSFPGAAVYGATKAAQHGFGEALRHELAGTGVGLTMVYPGLIRSSLHDHERDRMPAWYRADRVVPAEALARRIVEGVEKGWRGVFYPPNVRLLRIVHGVNPALADLMLRRIMHRSVAP